MLFSHPEFSASAMLVGGDHLEYGVVRAAPNGEVELYLPLRSVRSRRPDRSAPATAGRFRAGSRSGRWSADGRTSVWASRRSTSSVRSWISDRSAPPSCSGAGSIPASRWATCRDCSGRGYAYPPMAGEAFRQPTPIRRAVADSVGTRTTHGRRRDDHEPARGTPWVARMSSQRFALLALVCAVGALLLEGPLEIRGRAPDFVLVLIVYGAFRTGALGGSVLGFAGGLFRDTLVLMHFGLHALGLTVIGYGIGKMRESLYLDAPAIDMLLLAVSKMLLDVLVLGVAGGGLEGVRDALLLGDLRKRAVHDAGRSSPRPPDRRELMGLAWRGCLQDGWLVG